MKTSLSLFTALIAASLAWAGPNNPLVPPSVSAYFDDYGPAIVGEAVGASVTASAGDHDAGAGGGASPLGPGSTVTWSKGGSGNSFSGSVPAKGSDSWSVTIIPTKPGTLSVSGSASSDIPPSASDSDTIEVVCPDLTGGTIGPISFSLPAPVEPGAPGDTTCPYSIPANATATIALPIAGIETNSRSLDLTGVTITCNLPHGDLTNFSNFTLSWSGTKDYTLMDGKIKVTVSSISVKLPTTSSQMEGTAHLSFLVLEDVNMGRPTILLKKDSSANIELTYDGQGGVTPKFSGINIHADFLKIMTDGTPNAVLAKFTATDADQDATGATTAIKGHFHVNPLDPINIRNTQFKLNMFDCNGTVHIDGPSMKIEDGQIQADVIFPPDKESVTHLKGRVQLSGQYTEADGFAGQVDIQESDPLLFAGGYLFGHVSGHMSPAFELNDISGSNIHLHHANVGQTNLVVSSFNYSGDALQTLNVAKASVVYKNVAVIDFSDASWDNTSGILQFQSAHVVFGNNNVVLNVIGFNLNANEKVFLVESFEGDANFPRITAHISGSILATGFEAEMSGKFVTVDFDGSIGMHVFGVEPNTYNYAHVTLGGSFGATGIPMGEIPIKLRSLSGGTGYNESKQATGWQPSQGSYMVGAGVGLSDLSNLVLIEGQVEFLLSDSAPVFNIGGHLGVPASGDRYVDGNVNVSYTLGSGHINGTAATSLRFPPNGKVVSLDSHQITFDVGSTNVSLIGGNMSGKLCQIIDITGGFNLQGNPQDLSSLSGAIGGTLSYGNHFSVNYPSNFDPDTATGTTWFGFGIAATVNYHFDASANLALANGDCSGSVNVNLSGSAVGKIQWSSWVGSDISDFNASMTCNGSIRKDAGSSIITLNGSIHVSYNSYSDDFSVPSDLPIITLPSL